MDDKQLMEALKKIAAMPYDYVSADMTFGQIWLEDRRDQEVNPFWSQTESGFFFEMYYGQPGYIWTPWGKWNCWGSGAGSVDEQGRTWDDIMGIIAKRLDLRVYKERETNWLGDFGPVFSIHSVDGIDLPEPVARKDKREFVHYEVARQQWLDAGGAKSEFRS